MGKPHAVEEFYLTAAEGRLGSILDAPCQSEFMEGSVMDAKIAMCDGLQEQKILT
jgi:hypothetical protein